MTEKELRELEKFAKENGYNDELKDIYLRASGILDTILLEKTKTEFNLQLGS